MCQAYLQVYPEPDLYQCVEWIWTDDLYDWYADAIDFGYFNDDGDWTVDDNNFECAKLWYEELWTSEDFKTRGEYCGANSGGHVLGSGDDYSRDAIIPGITFEVYDDHDSDYYGGCRTTTTTPTNIELSYYEQCIATTSTTDMTSSTTRESSTTETIIDSIDTMDTDDIESSISFKN